MSLENLFIDRMTIEAMTPSATSAGAVARAWTTEATDVPCRLQPVTSHRQLVGLKFEIAPTHRLFFGQQATLDERRRARIGSSVYEILAVALATEPGRPSVAWVRRLPA